MLLKWSCNQCQAIISYEKLEKPQKCLCGSENFILLSHDEEAENKIKYEFGLFYEKIVEIIKYYVDLPENEIKLLSLHIIATYFFEKFNSFPYGYINGMKGSGKTRLLRIISYLSYGGDGTIQSSIKEATIFRMKEGQPLILDECENLGRKNNELIIELLNTCYKKGSIITRYKKIKNKNKEEWEKEEFKSYRPVWLANIWGLDNVLADRAIPYIVEKSNNPLKVKKMENFENNKQILDLKENLNKICGLVSFVPCRYVKNNIIDRWNLYVELKYNDTNSINNINNINDINDTNNINQTDILEKELIDELFFKIDEANINGRNLELFFPLFLVAREMNEEIFKEILFIAKEKTKEKTDSDILENKDINVYEFIAMLPANNQYYFGKDLTEKFKIFMGDEDFINEKWLGRALKRLNLIIDKKRVANGRLYLVNVKKAEEKIKFLKNTLDNEGGEKEPYGNP